MTDYVTNQSGDATVSTVFTPNGVPGAGDTITVATGHALTNLSGILGDDIGAPLTIQGTGSAALSGNLELRPPAALGAIAFQGGTLDQGGHGITIAPAANGAFAATFANNGGAATVWNSAAGASLQFSNVRGATTCQLFAKGTLAGFSLNINWVYQIVNGFGNGVALPCMPDHHIESGDFFTWSGGRLWNCGRVSWRDGGNPPGEFNVSIAIGGWVGTDYGTKIDQNQNDCVWRIERSSAGTGSHSFAGSVWYKDPADTRYLQVYLNTTYFPVDFSECVFINFGMTDRAGVAHDFTGSMVVATDDVVQSADFGVQVDSGAGSNTIIENLSVLMPKGANPHAPSITGDVSATYTVGGLICDGLGSDASTGEVGDQPICNIPVTINNFLCVHGAGGPNASLSGIGQVNGNRWTLHNAAGIILGETTAAAQHIGTVRNVLLSEPARGNFVFDAGPNLTNQTSAVIDYVAYDAADMTGTNEVHPTLGGLGYVNNATAAYVDGYGTNDILVADPQFAFPSRHGLGWAFDLGFAATFAGLEAALLALKGCDTSGASVAVVAGATPAAYRAYMIEGYTPQNSALDGTGFGGVDIGAIDVNAVPAGLLSSYNHFNRGFNA